MLDDNTGQPTAKASNSGKLKPSLRDGITSADDWERSFINSFSSTVQIDYIFFYT